MKKRLKISDTMYEDLTFEEILEIYNNYFIRKSKAFSNYGKNKYPIFSSSYEEEDIYQICAMGAFKAYKRYDINKDLLFYTYMNSMVIGEVLKYIRYTAGARREYNANQHKQLSIDYTINNVIEDKNISLGELIEDNNFSIDKIIQNIDVENLLSILDDKEREIINLLFFEGKTQLQIGQLYGHNQVWVSRKIKRILKKLRNYNKKKELQSLEKQKLHEEERKLEMAKKPKFEYDDLMSYLKKNASKDVSISSVIKDYAKIVARGQSTVFAKANQDKEAYDEIKAMYKDTNVGYPKTKSKAQATKLKEKAIIDNNTSLIPQENSIMPTDINKNILLEPANPILVPIQEKVLNPFNGLNIKSIQIDFNNFTANINNNNVSLDLSENENKELTIDDLNLFKEDLDKVIQLLNLIQ